MTDPTHHLLVTYAGDHGDEPQVHGLVIGDEATAQASADAENLSRLKAKGSLPAYEVIHVMAVQVISGRNPSGPRESFVDGWMAAWSYYGTADNDGDGYHHGADCAKVTASVPAGCDCSESQALLAATAAWEGK